MWCPFVYQSGHFRKGEHPFRLDGEQFTAAALCIGGTAFAASAQSWFPLLFTHGGDAGLEGYVQMADNAKLADENEHYRLSVESVLFDESAGTGVISLHLENKQQDGVKPFTLAHLLDSYRNKPDMTWTTLSSVSYTHLISI